MADIPDLTSDAYKEEKDFREVLTRVLKELNKQAGGTTSLNLGKNVILPAVYENDFVPPRGWRIMDGTQGTFNPDEVQVIYIQKI